MSEFLAFAHTLADAAGAAIRPYFGAHVAVEAKGDNSPVTIADRAAEAAMRALIEREYPTHGIYGEEFGTSGGASAPRYTWVLDPIDGTRAFIAGRREWGTLIALCEDGVPVLGILDQPITGERWVGVKNHPTMYWASPRLHAGVSRHMPKSVSGDPGIRRDDGIPIHTRPCPSLAEASISTTSRRYFTAPQAVQFARLAEQCREVIEDGDCYAYGLLACGERDIVIDAGLKPYDILALVPIIEGAGGRITTWDGAALTMDNYRDVVAVGSLKLDTSLQYI